MKGETDVFKIESMDSELHCIRVIMVLLDRHLTNKEPCTSDEHEQELKERRIRVLRYCLERHL